MGLTNDEAPRTRPEYRDRRDEPAGPPNGGRRITKIAFVLRRPYAGKSVNQIMNHSHLVLCQGYIKG
jgi:hypothetical protein